MKTGDLVNTLCPDSTEKVGRVASLDNTFMVLHNNKGEFLCRTVAAVCQPATEEEVETFLSL